MTSEHQTWQRDTSIRRIEAEQLTTSPPPLAHSIAAAARYVGAEAEQVRTWWQGRGR